MVGSLTRKPRALSGVESPPSKRSVSATRASAVSAGWQHVNISASRSSGGPASPDGSGATSSTTSSG